MLERERLEIQPVSGVVISGDGFGVAVVHNSLKSHPGQSERRLTAAIVEFDSLTNAIRSAAEDKDFLFLRGLGLVVHLVGAVQGKESGT